MINRSMLFTRFYAVIVICNTLIRPNCFYVMHNLKYDFKHGLKLKDWTKQAILIVKLTGRLCKILGKDQNYKLSLYNTKIVNKLYTSPNDQ